MGSDKFTQAIEIEPTNHILYSNRSAAYASKKDYENALKDADKVTEIKPDWAKGWGRKGAAKHGLGDLIGALDAYEEGLKLDPNNAQNKSGLASVQRAIDAEAKEGMHIEIPTNLTISDVGFLPLEKICLRRPCDTACAARVQTAKS